MPFHVIEGTFRLVGQTAAGNPSGFEPDGDSIQFRPLDRARLDVLERVDEPVRLTSIGSTQLRFEGIDALELHFQGTNQPRPQADHARDFLTGELNLNPVPYRAPDNVRVQPPVQRDATPGFILSRALEAHGRPVAFAFEGAPPEPDGSELVLEPALLRESLNFRSMAAGHSYPLFYDTLFGELRDALTEGAVEARDAGRGVWADDRSQAGLAVSDRAALERDALVLPKLFRRLTEFLRTHTGGLDAFLPWLADKREQLLDLSSGNFTHFDNVLAVQSETIRLTRRPEQLVFISAKSASPSIAPWLSV